MKIFITGASSGIGKALVSALAQNGHEVWGIARRENLLHELSKNLPTRVQLTRCDITQQSDLQDLYYEMTASGFIPDVVFLNAAVDIEESYPEISENTSTTIFRTNLESSSIIIGKFAQAFVKRGSGQFIAVNSLYAFWPDPSCVTYASSKAGLSMLFRGLRIRYRKDGILFKSVFLGPIATNINPRFKDIPRNDNSLIVASPENTAKYLTSVISSSRSNFYYPFYINVVILLLRWLPDNLFEFLTKKFRR